jgi:hypothetical protein
VQRDVSHELRQHLIKKETIMKMNKKLLMLGATFAIVVQFDTIAMAANVDGSATVEIVEPLTITESNGLNFGKIASGTTSGTINVNTAGTVTKTAGPADLQVVDAAGSAGVFAIAGEPSLLFTVTVPASTSLSPTGTSGGAPMNVTLASDATTINAAGLDGLGDATLTVTGDLAVGANQAADTYSGIYNVTVFYQ